MVKKTLVSGEKVRVKLPATGTIIMVIALGNRTKSGRERLITPGERAIELTASPDEITRGW